MSEEKKTPHFFEEKFAREKLDEQLMKDFDSQQEEAQTTSQDSSSYEQSKLFIIFIIIILLGAIAFFVYSWYQGRFATEQNDSIIPIVKATDTIFREKPEDPGGLYIPNRDKEVYQTIAADKSHLPLPRVTQILPKPEEPIARETLPGNSSKAELTSLLDTPPSYQEQPSIRENTLSRQQDSKPVAAPADPSAEFSQRSTLNHDKKMAEAAPNDNRTAIKNSTNHQAEQSTIPDLENLTVKDVTFIPTPSIKQLDKESAVTDEDGWRNRFALQLGSYRSEQAAHKEWLRIQKKYHTLLRDVTYKVEKVNLADKGVYYRLKTGPFTREAEARKICQELKEHKQGCFLASQ